MSHDPEILNVRSVARSRLFEIEALDLRFGNGEQRTFERLQAAASGAVLIVPLIDADSFWLIREYAAGTERYELGFPKGRIEPGEDPLAAANRELREELGLAARRLEPVTRLSLAPGYFGHMTEVVLAGELHPDALEGDEPEPLELVRWRFDDLAALLARDDFTEARSIAALFLIRERFKHE
ncbi:ADP compounds hydrolase NudE [Thiohalobacter sp. COW1]|uniref:NTP pyrophosphohydrolases n=1 Tax=Thiohalobacter thiocyanaticus TaxID=585455 RepID=A0A1Z4VP35_9GAMM|nr:MULTISPECIES: ADP compounds hydrolase NudE [Thiohalobacter]BAZ93182.1 NTP pyrophosphohydrolases [Thiohalobacter thiocyanaticus]BCO31806.1 ADP compounds hydrolase NudE [Thiohalobacter sp. COW1]